MPLPRIDRLASLYIVKPLRAFVSSREIGIPILMYHSISCDEKSTRNPYFWTCTSPPIFREQIKFLVTNGYHTLSITDAVQRIESAAGSLEKLVVITFDDGFRDFYTEAYPLLSEFGLTATVFLPTAYIHDSAHQFKGAPCLTWREVRELSKAGIDFGSHTVTHPVLTSLPMSEVRRELFASKEEVECRLGAGVASFSYPYAFPDADGTFQSRFRDVLLEAGYRNGVTTKIGRASRKSERFFLERLPVNSGDDIQLFNAKLEGAYNWLGPIQDASKRIRSTAAS